MRTLNIDTGEMSELDLNTAVFVVQVDVTDGETFKPSDLEYLEKVAGEFGDVIETLNPRHLVIRIRDLDRAQGLLECFSDLDGCDAMMTLERLS